MTVTIIRNLRMCNMILSARLLPTSPAVHY